MLVLDSLWRSQLEHIFHVLQSLPAFHLGLRRVEVDALDDLVEDRQADSIADTAGNLHTLVVAALTLSLPRDRHWYNGIDVIEEMVPVYLLGHQTTHVLAEVGLMVVFHVVYQTASV